MTPVDQSKLHDPDNGIMGDCWRACVASILDLPLGDVPELESASDPYDTLSRWACLRGCYLLGFEPGNPPFGYSIAVGPSPRGKNRFHCCIAKDGEIVFDPHPDRTGLKEIHRFEVIRNAHENDMC